MRREVSARRSAVRRFFGTPKGLLIIVLLILAALAAASEGVRLAAPGLLSAVAAAVLIDAPILRAQIRRVGAPERRDPDRTARGHGPQPARAVVCRPPARRPSPSSANTSSGRDRPTCSIRRRWPWWSPSTSSIPARAGGARCPRSSPLALPVLLVSGIFIANRVNKLPMVLAFLGGYFLLFTATSFVGAPGRRRRDLPHPGRAGGAVLRVLHPDRSADVAGEVSAIRCVCGAIVAAVSFAVFEWVGAAYYLLAGVLVGNVWEAWSRWRLARRRRRAAAVAATRPPDPAGSPRGRGSRARSSLAGQSRARPGG